MTQEERQQTLDECRRFYVAAPVVVPLIEKQRKLAFDKLMGEYRDRSGKYESLIAELYVLTNMEREFNVREQMLRTLEEKK